MVVEIAHEKGGRGGEGIGFSGFVLDGDGHGRNGYNENG